MSVSDQNHPPQQGQSSGTSLQLGEAYPPIRLPALAAAASMMARPQKTVRPELRDVPSVLRDEDLAS